MAKEWTNGFYNSKAWRSCRASYAKSVGGLCERCRANGIYRGGRVVHHKIYLSPDVMDRPDILLNFNNLELLCQDCHEKEHSKVEKRYSIDEEGNILPLEKIMAR